MPRPAQEPRPQPEQARQEAAHLEQQLRGARALSAQPPLALFSDLPSWLLFFYKG